MHEEYIIPEAVEIKSMFSAFEKTFDNNFSFDGESHDFWEIVCIMDGKVGITADNDIYTLEAGQVVFHKPMEFHRIRSEGGTSPRVIIFSFKAEAMPPITNRLFRMNSHMKDTIEALFARRPRIFDEPDMLKARRFVKQLELFILTLIMSGADEDVYETTRGAESYRAAVNVLKENLEKNLTVEEIADACNMSPSNVKRVFAKYSGMGVIAYYNHLKVEQAKKLLASGMSIKEASAALGYENQNYFSTMFKRIDGVPPGKYKSKK